MFNNHSFLNLKWTESEHEQMFFSTYLKCQSVEQFGRAMFELEYSTLKYVHILSHCNLKIQLVLLGFYMIDYYKVVHTWKVGKKRIICKLPKEKQSVLHICIQSPCIRTFAAATAAQLANLQIKCLPIFICKTAAAQTGWRADVNILFKSWIKFTCGLWLSHSWSDMI